MKVQSNRFEEIICWYETFSLAGPPDRTLPTANKFWRVDPVDIQECEKLIGFEFPAGYREFLCRVGVGHFALGCNEVFVEYYANEFLGPREIGEILTKKSGEWLIYPEFIFPGEFPFFDLGSADVLVFRHSEGPKGKVYFPGTPDPISNSFEEFLYKLREDAQFYVGLL